MTRNGFYCIDWQGPFALRYDSVSRGKRAIQTVYRVDHLGEPVYIGCTRHPVPHRLYLHSRREYPFGVFLRETPAAEISVSIIEDAGSAVERLLIPAVRPRFNRMNVPGECAVLNPEQRAAVAKMRADGMRLEAIGVRFGVTRQAIHQMLRRIAA